MNDRQAHAVILAGGSGSRLWPLSRQHLPKQFLSLDGNASLLQTTINRLSPVIEAKNVLIVTQEAHAKGEAYHALLPYQTLFEPVARNTAPAIALAAARLMADGADPIMVVLPADHIIKDEARFREHLNIAIAAAESGKLITFGIRPTRPDTGFGYVKAHRGVTPEVYEVDRFTEKPDAVTAERFLKEGDYYWNSGMFVWRASVILAEIRQHLPAVDKVIQAIIAESRSPGEFQQATFQQAVEKHFSAMPSISIDYGVLEKSSRVSLVPCDIGWNDVGSWQAVHEIAAKDENGNALQGNVIALDCKNSLIRAEKRLVAAIGVEALCVIETADAILISKSDQTQRVREVVYVLHPRGSTEHVHPDRLETSSGKSRHRAFAYRRDPGRRLPRRRRYPALRRPLRKIDKHHLRELKNEPSKKSCADHRHHRTGRSLPCRAVAQKRLYRPWRKTPLVPVQHRSYRSPLP